MDGLGPRILKMAGNFLAPAIAVLINKSIVTGLFSIQLTQAKILPIHKRGPKADLSNYRPISLLPTVSKYSKNTLKNFNGLLE